MNVLFVLYESIDSNSGLHVQELARHLGRLGADTVAAVYRPGGPGEGSEAAVRTVGFRDGATVARAFADGRPPDIVHAWTPRENVRTFCERLRKAFPFKLVVHLEDNEECLLERLLGVPFETLARNADTVVPETLSHPIRYREFLASADGVTVIVDPLREFVPAGKPSLLLWPGVDTERFSPRTAGHRLAAQARLPAGTLVLGYTGNVHPANAREVRSVYIAAALLSREGQPAVVLRTGRDFCAFLGEDDSWARPHARELGVLPYDRLPDALAMADVLVQPGRPDRFNDYRFPSKLPEYLAMGKPVVTPRANLGLHLTHRREALVYPVVDALQIVEAAREVAADRALRRQLAEGSLAFVKAHLDWRRRSESLKEFYEGLAGIDRRTRAEAG